MSGPQPGTPTPWRVEQDTTLIWGACSPDDSSNYGLGYPVTECRITPAGSWAKRPWADEGEANAAAIAHRMNNWDAVVEALEELLPVAERSDRRLSKAVGKARTALTLAKSGGNS